MTEKAKYVISKPWESWGIDESSWQKQMDAQAKEGADFVDRITAAQNAYFEVALNALSVLGYKPDDLLVNYQGENVTLLCCSKPVMTVATRYPQGHGRHLYGPVAVDYKVTVEVTFFDLSEFV